MGKLVFLPNDIPALDDSSMQMLATKFYHTFQEWQWSRQPQISQWDDNDRVFHCKRRLPIIDGMPFIDPENSKGPTDIFDHINKWAMKLSQAQFPKDDSWMTLVGRSGEDPAVTNLAREQQLWMHRKLGTRSIFGKHFRQLGIRGTSALLLDWKTETIQRKVFRGKSASRVRDFMVNSGVNPKDLRALSRVREEQITYNGPTISILDMRDVLFPPEAELGFDRKNAYIIQTYRRPTDLQREFDDQGKNVYSNLEDLETIKAAQLYYQGYEKYGRLENLNVMGIYPQNYSTNSTELVHVLVCYVPYIKTDDDLEFWDTYFHVAIYGGAARMIRVEESPTTESGARHFITDTFVDWFTGHPYGISAVEHLVSIYDRAAFIDALNLSANAASAYPAIAVASGAFKDDVVDRTPGAINEIAANIAGTRYAEELPTMQHASEAGMMQMRWYSQKMGESFGGYGANGESAPTRSIGSRKTATEANIEASSGNLSIDEQSEKFGISQREVCQWVYDMSRVRLIGEFNSQKNAQVVSFSTGSGSQRLPAELKLDDFDQPRTVEILGLHGAITKQQNIQNKNEALKVLAQTGPLMPNSAVLTQGIVKSLWTDLNIETKPEDWLSPQQLAAQDPQVMQMAAQNPQVIIQALVQGLNNPALMQQALNIDAQMQQQQQGQQGGPPNAQPNPAQQPPSAPQQSQVPS